MKGGKQTNQTRKKKQSPKKKNRTPMAFGRSAILLLGLVSASSQAVGTVTNYFSSGGVTAGVAWDPLGSFAVAVSASMGFAQIEVRADLATRTI